jgi:hypothetical protein
MRSLRLCEKRVLAIKILLYLLSENQGMKGKIILILFLVFSFSLCEGQSWAWGAMGSRTSDTWAVTGDAKGNAYLAGFFFDSITFGNRHLASPGTASYLVKYDSLGNLLWVTEEKAANTLSSVIINSMTTDNFGNEYVIGDFIDTAIFGIDTIHAFGQSVFLAKYDASGSVLWVKEAPVPSPKSIATGYSAANDDSGNVYITGNFIDTITFGSTILRTIQAPYYYGGSVFLAKYDDIGNVKWAKQANVPSSVTGGTGFSVATDKTGNVYVTGGFIDTISFGAYTLKSIYTPYGFAGFLVKYNPNGNVVWAKQSSVPSSTSYGYGSSVATNQTGDIYIAGQFLDTISFGAHTLISSGSDILVVKYDSDGNVRWAKQSLSGVFLGYSVSADSLNHIYISSGGSNGSGKVIFGKDTFSYNSVSWDNSIIIELDSSGNALCGSSINGGGDDNNTIVSDKSGKYVYWGGDLEKQVIFGKDTLNGIGSEPPFIARWQPCETNIETSTKSISNENSISLFPNPSTGLFTLAFAGQQNFVSGTVEIYNVMGQRVESKKLKVESLPCGSQGEEIDLTSQPSGVYFYRVINEDESLIGEGKVIIEK